MQQVKLHMLADIQVIKQADPVLLYELALEK